MGIKPIIVTENLNLYPERICGDVVHGTAILTKGNEKIIKFFTVKLYQTKKYEPPIEYYSDPPVTSEQNCSYMISKDDFNSILSTIKEKASRFLTVTFDNFELGKDDIEKLHPTFKQYRNLLRVYLSDESYSLWSEDYTVRHVPRTFRMEVLHKGKLLFWVPKVETVSTPPARELQDGKTIYELISNRFFIIVVENGNEIEKGIYWRWNSDFQVKFFKNGEIEYIFHSDTIRRNDLFNVKEHLANIEVVEKNGKRLLTLERKNLPKHVKSFLDSLAPHSLRIDGKYIFIPDEWTVKNYNFTKGD